MFARSHRGRRAWIARSTACLALGAVIIANPVRAQCTYTSLASATAVTTGSQPQFFSFNQTSVFYSAVAIRPAAGEDWNIEVFQATAASPACVSTSLGSSSRTSGVDFVLGDFNVGHNPIGLHYPVAQRVAGAANATMEWDDGANSITVNGPLLSRTTGASDVIEVWDVNLSAGVSYTFTFNPSGASLKLLLFKSSAGAYWAGRDAALFEVAAGTTYTPAASGFHGVVVINDDGAAGSYALGIGTCDASTPLVAGTTATTTRAEKYYSLDQQQPYWMAVGVRGTSNWQVAAYGQSSGGSYPTCFGDSLMGSSLAAPAVDLVVGNFNLLLTGTHYARVYLQGHVGSGTATVEWDNGADIITVGDPPLNRSTGATDVLEAWDVYFDHTLTYDITFTTAGADLKLLIFHPDATWEGRAARLVQLSGSASTQSYSPPADGWYGLVVVNDNGATGTYSLGVGSGTVSVGGAGPLVTELSGIAPNPARHAVTLSFSLRTADRVGFEFLDVAGRLAAEIPARRWEAGRWSLVWDRRDPRSGRAAPGVYFVRMTVGGRVVGKRKLVVLD
jgi:hypothetical protein